MEGRTGMQQQKNIQFRKSVSTLQISHSTPAHGTRLSLHVTTLKSTTYHPPLSEKASNHSPSTVTQPKYTDGLMVPTSQITSTFSNNHHCSPTKDNPLLFSNSEKLQVAMGRTSMSTVPSELSQGITMALQSPLLKRIHQWEGSRIMV